MTTADYAPAPADAPPMDDDRYPPEFLDPVDDHDSSFWDARSGLRHIYDFSRARRVAPLAVLGVTLARVITATPYTVGLPAIVGGKASLNLFVGLVGDSGSGKGAATAVSSDAVRVGYLETHTIGSGEGIAHGFMHRTKGGVEWNDDQHAVLFDIPEIDTLTALGDRRGATLLPELRRAWSGERLGFGYADPTKRLMVPAHGYRMGLIAGIQPLRAEPLLADADGGTPQRFLWMPATDPDAPDVPPLCPEPVQWRMPTQPGGLVAEHGSTTWEIPVCDTACRTIDQARLARLRHQADALDGHALLARLKIAAALALYDGRLAVTEDDWHLAGIVSTISDQTRRRVQHAIERQRRATGKARAEGDADRALVVADRVRDDAVQRVCRAVTKHLRANPTGLTHADLRRKIAARDRGDFEDALDRLTETGLIHADTTHRDAGGHGTRYRPKETA